MKCRNCEFFGQTLNYYFINIFLFLCLTFSLSVAEVVEHNNEGLTTLVTTTNVPLFKYYYGAKLSPTFSTPCTFPTPIDSHSWQKCHVELETAKKYNICDPESTIYFSKSN